MRSSRPNSASSSRGYTTQSIPYPSSSSSSSSILNNNNYNNNTNTLSGTPSFTALLQSSSSSSTSLSHSSSYSNISSSSSSFNNHHSQHTRTLSNNNNNFTSSTLNNNFHNNSTTTTTNNTTTSSSLINNNQNNNTNTNTLNNLNTNNNNNNNSTSTLYLNNIIHDSDDQSSLFKTFKDSNEIILCFQLLNEQLRNYIILKKITSISHLYLENNNINRIEDSIRKLNNPIQFLQYLNLTSNNLTKLNLFNIVRLFPNLEFLILRNNLISTLNNYTIPIYGNIKVLDLSNNKIKKIEGILPLKFSLQILNIQKNEIETFQDMKQILELELLTNIDFRGNPIKSLDEENLIFEEILDKCSNVWFINGATTLASPLIEDDKHSINSNSNNNSFDNTTNTNMNNNMNNNMSNMNMMDDNKNIIVTEDKLKSAEELLKKHSYIIEHLKTHKSKINLPLPSFNSTINNNMNNNINSNITTNNVSNNTNIVINNINNNITNSNNVSPSNQTTSTIYNDPAILKNLANFAKARSKRSDSCPSIPNNSNNNNNNNTNSTIKDFKLNEDYETNLTHSISSNLLDQTKNNDKNSLKLMEVKSFEQQVRNRQQSRALQLEQDKFDLNQEDSFLSNYQSLLSQKKNLPIYNTITNNTNNNNTNNNTINNNTNYSNSNNNMNNVMNNEEDDELAPPFETVKVELPSLMEKTSTSTLQKLQLLIDSNNLPPTPCKQPSSTSPPSKDLTTPQNNPTSNYTTINNNNTNSNSSSQHVSPPLSSNSSSSNYSNNYSTNNTTLNISAIPHSLNQSTMSNISMNLSQINSSFLNSTPSLNITYNIQSNSTNNNVTSNSGNSSVTPSANRALSIKERAKQNMLKKLNM